MSFHEEVFHLNIDPVADGILELITAFYTQNGYIKESEDEAEGRAVFIRGKSSAGWWSSDMTNLHTVVTVSIKRTQARLDYRVNITGQRLLDEDREFWKKEARALAATVEQGAEIVDLRPEEARRAEALAKNMRKSGVWYGFAIFLTIIIAFLVANFLGS